MKYLPLLALVFSLFIETAHAQAGELDATQPESSSVQWELDGINHQQWTAHALYVTSTVLGVLGTASIGLGEVVQRLTGSFEPLVLFATGGALLLAHIVTMVIGASLDLGSASHRRKLLTAHPELSFSLTPGPGDAGLGLALHF